MICDKLASKDYNNGLTAYELMEENHLHYTAKKVREAIAELKDKVQMHDFFWEGCGFEKRGFKNAIAVANHLEDVERENDKLKAELAAMKEERRWHKCSEELPPHDTWCLVYHEGEIGSDHYTDDCNSHDRFVMYGPFVTHWMPMPKAPEADK